MTLSPPDPIETREVALTPGQYRRFLTRILLRRRGGLFAGLWGALIVFLVLQGADAGIGVGRMLAGSWPLFALLGGLSLWSLWGWPALFVRSRRAAVFYRPFRCRFEEGRVTVEASDGTLVQRPYGGFVGFERTDELLVLEQDNTMFLLIPLSGFASHGEVEMLEGRLRGLIPIPARPPEDGSQGPVGWLRGLRANLLAGLRLALFRPLDRVRIAAHPDQLLLLALLLPALQFGADLLLTPAPRVFEPWGLHSSAVGLLLLLVAVHLVARINGAPERFVSFAVVLFSVLVPFVLLLRIFEEGTVEHDWAAGVAWAVLLWMVIGWVRGLRLVFGDHPGRVAASLLVLLLVALLPHRLVPHSGYWFAEYTEEDEATVDVEAVYYSQPQMMQQALQGVVPGRSGVVDLYHIGFAGYADEAVFRREAEHVRDLLDHRLDTLGRSMLLVNHPETVARYPIASRTNLRVALQAVGQRMNPEEDVLFLYLTSHGGEDSTFAVDFWPLGLNTIRPEDLRAALDDAGIRWRVVVISACYSGTFVDALRGDGTLVMTAAAADRTSFGCSNENEYTYFGEALFKQGLGRTRSLSEAFEVARGNIAERERREGLESSRPVMVAGEGILERLRRFEQRLADEEHTGLPVEAGG